MKCTLLGCQNQATHFCVDCHRVMQVQIQMCIQMRVSMCIQFSQSLN